MPANLNHTHAYNYYTVQQSNTHLQFESENMRVRLRFWKSFSKVDSLENCGEFKVFFIIHFSL